MQLFEAASILWQKMQKKKEKGEMTKLEFLNTIPFFENLSPRELNKVSEVIHERTYEEGEYIFEIDHPGAALFVIWSGEVVIEVPSSGDRMSEIAHLSDGAFLGELALLNDAPRSASARAAKRTRTIALFRKNLNQLIESDPEIACQILKTLAQIVGERLKDTNALLKVEDAA